MPTTVSRKTLSRKTLVRNTLSCLLVTAAVAVPVVSTVTPAQAATSSQWDRVAACESGGNWSIDTGNSFYGGLQFTRSTWSAFGGGAYASTADRASRSQQISVAEKVLASQGPGAWPVCSRGVLTGADASTQSAPVAAPRVRNHRATAAPSTGTSSTRTTTTRVAPAGPIGRGSDYVIVAGDILSVIAQRASLNGWDQLYAANSGVIGTDPDVIIVGMTLHIPA